MTVRPSSGHAEVVPELLRLQREQHLAWPQLSSHPALPYRGGRMAGSRWQSRVAAPPPRCRTVNLVVREGGGVALQATGREPGLHLGLAPARGGQLHGAPRRQRSATLARYSERHHACKPAMAFLPLLGLWV